MKRSDFITIANVTYTAWEWAEIAAAELGESPEAILLRAQQRTKKGWAPERAFFAPKVSQRESIRRSRAASSWGGQLSLRKAQ